MKASLFVPCLVDQFLPEVGLATAQCLAAAGCQVDYPDRQTCCGQAFLNSGMTRDAARLARGFVHAFADSQWVVAPSGSCVQMVRDRYGDLLEGRDLADWEDLRTRVFELTDFLGGNRGIEAWQGSWEGRAVLHWSCHLPQDGPVQAAVEKLLNGIDGLRLLPRPEFECCGFGGSFWALWRDVSAVIGRRRLEVLSRDDPDTLVLAEPGCLLQMRMAVKESGRDIRVLHVAEVLAEALT